MTRYDLLRNVIAEVTGTHISDDEIDIIVTDVLGWVLAMASSLPEHESELFGERLNERITKSLLYFELFRTL